MTVQCCVCRQVRQGGQWFKQPVPENERTSHGYCPQCLATARVEVEKLCHQTTRHKSAAVAVAV